MSVRRGAVLIATASLFFPLAVIPAGATAVGVPAPPDRSATCASAVVAAEEYRTGSLPELVPDRIERVARYEDDLDAAEAALTAAEQALTTAEEALTAAEERLAAAEEELARAEESGTAEEVAAAQDALAVAEEARTQALAAVGDTEAARSDAFDSADALRSILDNEERLGRDVLIGLIEGLDLASITEQELAELVALVGYVVDEEYAELLGAVGDACFDDAGRVPDEAEPSTDEAEPSTAPAARPVKARADFTG